MAAIKVDAHSLINALCEDKAWVSRAEFKKVALERLAEALNAEIKNTGGTQFIDSAKLVSSLTTIDISVVGLEGIKESIGAAFKFKWGDVWDSQEELVRLIRDYAIEVAKAYDFLKDKEVEKLSEKIKVCWKFSCVVLSGIISMCVVFVCLMAMSSMIYGLGVMPAILSGPIMILYTPNTLISSPSGLFIIAISIFAGVSTSMVRLKSFLKYIWTKQKGLTKDDVEAMKSQSAEKIILVIKSINAMLAKHYKIKAEKSVG